jgi:hypothetical protein
MSGSVVVMGVMSFSAFIFECSFVNGQAMATNLLGMWPLLTAPKLTVTVKVEDDASKQFDLWEQ